MWKTVKCINNRWTWVHIIIWNVYSVLGEDWEYIEIIDETGNIDNYYKTRFEEIDGENYYKELYNAAIKQLKDNQEVYNAHVAIDKQYDKLHTQTAKELQEKTELLDSSIKELTNRNIQIEDLLNLLNRINEIVKDPLIKKLIDNWIERYNLEKIIHWNNLFNK